MKLVRISGYVRISPEADIPTCIPSKVIHELELVKPTHSFAVLGYFLYYNVDPMLMRVIYTYPTHEYAFIIKFL